MTKTYCDCCGREIAGLEKNKVNIVDTCYVLGIDWEEGSRTYCELCSDCKKDMHGEIAAVLGKYSGAQKGGAQ